MFRAVLSRARVPVTGAPEPTLPRATSGVPGLCAALLVFGAATGAVNVAANSVGVQVEARAGRPLLSGLHAAFSAGGLLGALVGGLASAVLGVAPHLVAVALLGLALMAWAGPVLVGGDADVPAAGAVDRRAGAHDGPRATAVL